MEPHTRSSQRRPHSVLLIDLENFGLTSEARAPLILDAILSAAGPVDRIYAAAAHEGLLTAYQPHCETRNIHLITAPSGKDGADKALLNTARNWANKPEGAVFHIASCDHIFASLAVASVVTQEGRGVAKKLQEKTSAIQWFSLTRKGGLAAVATEITNPAKFRQLRKTNPQLARDLVTV